MRAEMVELVDLLDEAATSRATVSFGMPTSGTSCTMHELWVDANRMSAALSSETDAPSIGFVLEPTRSSVACVLGAWIAGFRVVSIPPPSHKAMAGRLTGIAELEELDLIIANRDEHVALRAASERQQSPEDLDTHVTPRNVSSRRRDPRLVQYTSGSIGDPAGVELTTAAIAANITAILEVVDPSAADRALSWLPLYHDMGLIGMLLSSLVGFGPQFAGGSHLTLLAPEVFVRDPRNWLRTCAAEQATITAGPTSAFEIATLLRPSRPDLASMRMAMIGAEPVHAHVVDRFVDTFAPHGLPVNAVCPAYGLAEATVAVSISSPQEPIRRAVIDSPCAGQQPAAVIGSGQALTGVDVRIADSDQGVGRIMVKGPNLLSRYTGRRVADIDDAGYFDTNDTGFVRDGQLFVLGRADDVITVGGRKLYPADIESNVARALSIPTRSVAAIAITDGYELLIERRSSIKRLPDAEVRALVNRAVGPIGANPATVTITNPGQLPTTANGKLRHRIRSDED